MPGTFKVIPTTGPAGFTVVTDTDVAVETPGPYGPVTQLWFAGFGEWCGTRKDMLATVRELKAAGLTKA